MKKEYGKYIAIILGIICIILIITLISIRLSNVNAQSENLNLKQKISEEISYIDSNIIEIMNKLNNIDVIKYKVYTKEINESQDNASNSTQNSSQETQDSESEKSEGDSQNSSSSQEGSQSNSSENQTKSPTTISELVPNTSLSQGSQEPDWEQISFQMEKIYSTWPTINLDLQNQGITNELISNFSLSMDGVVQSIKNKDKNNTLINLFNMYINVPKYSSSINEDDNEQNLYNTKLNILNAYVIASTSDKWSDVTISITSAKDYFSKIVSNENKKASLQKCYVIIEDLERISQINDIDIFFMGYKNVMQELETNFI